MVWPIERGSADWAGMAAFACAILTVSTLLATIVRLVLWTGATAISGDATMTRGAGRAIHSLVPVTSARWSKRQVHCSVRFTTCAWRIVNCAGHTWNGSGSWLRMMGVAIKIASWGQGENGPPDGQPALDAELNSQPIGAGPCTNIAAAITPSRTQLRHNDDPSTAPAVFADAWRQMIALAKSLAREAARQDDAAEDVQERSRARLGRTSTK